MMTGMTLTVVGTLVAAYMGGLRMARLRTFKQEGTDNTRRVAPGAVGGVAAVKQARKPRNLG